MRAKKDTKQVKVEFEPDFHRRVKSQAALEGITMQALILDALEKRLDRAKAHSIPPPRQPEE